MDVLSLTLLQNDAESNGCAIINVKRRVWAFELKHLQSPEKRSLVALKQRKDLLHCSSRNESWMLSLYNVRFNPIVLFVSSAPCLDTKRIFMTAACYQRLQNGATYRIVCLAKTKKGVSSILFLWLLAKDKTCIHFQFLLIVVLFFFHSMVYKFLSTEKFRAW